MNENQTQTNTTIINNECAYEVETGGMHRYQHIRWLTSISLLQKTSKNLVLSNKRQTLSVRKKLLILSTINRRFGILSFLKFDTGLQLIN